MEDQTTAAASGEPADPAVIELCSRAAISEWEGLPKGVTRYDMRHIAKHATRALGLGKGPRALLVHLAETLSDEDWRRQQPHAYPSITTLALALEVDERQIHRYAAALIRARLLVRRRPQTRFNGTVGGNAFDLSMLGVRYEELRALADEADAYPARHSAARSTYHKLQRRLADALRALAELALKPAKLLEALRAALRDRRRSIGAAVPAAVIEAENANLAALEARAVAALAPVEKTSRERQASEASDETVRATESTTETSGPPDPSSTDVDNPVSPWRANARTGRERPGGGGAVSSATPPPGVDDTAFRLALGIASPEMLESYQRAPGAGWDGLAWAAESVLSRIGVHPTAWQDACGSMTLAEAALCALVTDVRHRLEPRDPRHVRSPGGYLRGLTRRARMGQLRIAGSVHGLAKAPTA